VASDRIFSWVILLALMASPALGQSAAVRLTDALEENRLGQHLRVLEDPQETLTFQDVSQGAAAQRFQPYQGVNPNFGITRSAYWVAWEVQNQSTKPVWILDIIPTLERVDLYVAHPGGKTEHLSLGSILPQGNQPFVHPGIYFRLPLKAGETYRFFLRAQGRSGVILPLVMFDEEAFRQHSVREARVFGLFYGLLGTMVIYNLVLLLLLRDRTYAVYLLLILTAAFLQLVLDGYARPLLYPNHGDLDQLFLLWGGFLLSGLVVLFFRFSHKVGSPVKRTSLGLDLILAVTLAFQLVTLADWFSGQEYYITLAHLNFLVAFLAVVMVAGYGLYFVQRGVRYTWLFLGGYLFLLLGGLGIILVSEGWIPANSWSLNSLKMGIGVDMVLFSLALAWRVQILQTEKSLAQDMGLQHLQESLAKAQENEALKQAQAELKIAHQQAEEAFQQAERRREKTEQATRFKDRFVFLVTQEIRSPLIAILTMTQTLDLEPDNPLSPTQKETVSRVWARGQEFLKTMDSLLQLNRVQTGKMPVDMGWIPIWPRVEEVMLRREEVERKGITLKSDITDHDRLWADPEMFTEVLRNLVSNAVKFCDSGDTILISLDKNHPNTLRVSDTGPGIPPAMLPDLFRDDVKTTMAGSRGEPGAGLGLPLCRELMAAQGGSIRVESRLGGGTTVFAEFPPGPKE